MITGYFMSVKVPDVAVGQDIKATIDFSALNPGALYWSTFLVVDSPGLGLKRLLDKARELGEEGGREKTYTLAKMPDKDVAISFFIFAHDDAGYDWDWGEYQNWMIGFPIEVTHLDSAFELLSPGEVPPEPPPPDGNGEPPEEGIFSGEIISVSPLQHRIGDEIALTVKYKVSTTSWLESVNGWWADAVVDVDSMTDKAESGMLTGKGPETLTQKISFGTMPEDKLYGTVDIVCFKGGYSGYSEVVATKKITLTPSELPPVPPPPPPDGNGEPPAPISCSIDSDCPEGYKCQDGVCVKKKEIPWPWIAAGVGLLLLLPGKKNKKGE